RPCERLQSHSDHHSVPSRHRQQWRFDRIWRWPSGEEKAARFGERPVEFALTAKRAFRRTLNSSKPEIAVLIVKIAIDSPGRAGSCHLLATDRTNARPSVQFR